MKKRVTKAWEIQQKVTNRTRQEHELKQKILAYAQWKIWEITKVKLPVAFSKKPHCAHQPTHETCW